MRRLTASGLELALHCDGANATPGLTVLASDEQRFGTGGHRYLRTWVKESRDAARAECAADAEWLACCDAIDETQIPQGDGADCEVTYALDPVTGEVRRVGRDLDRDYSGVPERFIPLTLDLEYVRDDSAFVIDWKFNPSGFGPPPVPARRNLQLAIAAVAVATFYGLTSVDVALGHVSPEGELTFDWHVFDETGLRDALARVRAIWERVHAARAARARGEELDLTIGEHCDKCGALARCGAMIGAVRALAINPNGEVNLASITPEIAGAAYARIGAIEKALSVMKDTIKTYAYQVGAIPLSDRKELAVRKSSGRNVDAEKAVAWLSEEGLPVPPPKVGIGQLEKLVKEHFAGEHEDVMARLERNGVVNKFHGRSLREVNRK